MSIWGAVASNEAIRKGTEEACRIADLSAERDAGWFARYEAQVTDSEGYLIEWASEGLAYRWRPYVEVDYLGVSADRTSQRYDPRCDVEAVLTTIEPDDIPENAHWKGWVW